MLLIRMNKDYFFISKPRCASTHLYEGLTNWNDKIHGDKPFYHITAGQMKNVFKQEYQNKFSFSVIRHPYELVISWYNEHRKPRYEQSVKDFYNISIDEWINKGCPTHWKHSPFNPLHQYKWVYDSNEVLLVSYLIRMEDYDTGIEYVYHQIKPSLDNSVTLETIGQTRKNESANRIELTEEQKKKIYQLFKKDFLLFGYSP